MNKIALAERFYAPQGEGVYTGTQMAFMRTVGCSVGKGTCTACDTDFDRVYADLGGGTYSPEDLHRWVIDGQVRHACLTGGEPFDRDLRPLLFELDGTAQVHVETSGTKKPDWLDPLPQPRQAGLHAIGKDKEPGLMSWRWMQLWVTVSPKPGYLPHMVEHVADEVKVILGGLGDGPGWPTVEDALRWADMGKTVYVQPRNHKHDVDQDALRNALELVAAHPQLRLSAQLHKFVRTR